MRLSAISPPGVTAGLRIWTFDLLHLDGLYLRGAALVDRKAVLAELLQDAISPFHLSEHLEAAGEDVYAAVVHEGFRRNGKPMFTHRNEGYDQKPE